MVSRCIFAAASLAFCLVTPCRANLVIFGDSLSDAGNTSFLTAGAIPPASAGYTSGAFTNGPNWLTTLANRLGEATPAASLTGGTNYAHGGASMTSTLLLRPSLADQVSSYLNDLPTPNSIPASDLHIIWGGANDLFANTTDSQALNVAATIHANISNLYQSGARRFLVMNLPSLGATPLVKIDPNLDGAELDHIGSVFNVALSNELASASATLSGIDIVEFDAASFLDEIIADPNAFGLSNVNDSAAPFDPDSFVAGLATGLPPSGVNPDEYLFYDGLHPTSVAHSLFGNSVANVLIGVPEPGGTCSLLLIAIPLLLARKRTIVPDACEPVHD